MLDLMVQRLALSGYSRARIERPSLKLNGCPRVSVVVPCYNYGRYLGDCLGSIFAQEGNHDFEIIAIDDCSSDNTREVIESFRDSRMRVILHEKNQGHIRTIAEGLQEARGRYVARIDADDRYRPCFLKETISRLDRHPEVGFVYGDAAIIGPEGQIYEDKTPSEHAREPTRNVAWRLCPDHFRKGRKPVAHRSGIVVDDIVDSRCAVLDGARRRLGRVVEVEERVTAEGKVLAPPDLDGARAALEEVYRAGIRAAAIVFLHGYRHPEHERKVLVAEQAALRWPFAVPTAVVLVDRYALREANEKLTQSVRVGVNSNENFKLPEGSIVSVKQFDQVPHFCYLLVGRVRDASQEATLVNASRATRTARAGRAWRAQARCSASRPTPPQ